MTGTLLHFRPPRTVPVREYVVTVATLAGGSESRRVCLSDSQVCDLALRLMDLYNSKAILDFSVADSVDCTASQLLSWLASWNAGGKDGTA